MNVLASGLLQRFRQIPCAVKHAHDQRWIAIRRVDDDVGKASDRKKADEW